MRQLQIAIALAPNVLLQKFVYITLRRNLLRLGEIQLDFSETLGCKNPFLKILPNRNGSLTVIIYD